MGNIKTYPVIFTLVEDGVLVEVPDLEIFTQGENRQDAVEMAKDAISLQCISLEDDNLHIPEASDISVIDSQDGTFSKEGKSYVLLVNIDLEEYRQKIRKMNER